MSKVGDDFEDEGWSYLPNRPKSSNNIDKNMREPIGISANQRIFESTYRGHPDAVKRVATPENGIPGSRGSLFLQSRITGVPGRPSGKQQQDDLMVNVYGILNREIGPQYQPSCTVRVFVPPWEKWEDRSGSSFGFRLDCEAWDTRRGEGFLAARYAKSWQSYWPGIFIVLNREADGFPKTHAQLLIRAGVSGEDILGPAVMEPGWYTLGMSITTNGEVHYFARKGPGELTSEDHIASSFPYGYRCEKFNLMFFNIVNVDDGRSISTPWIIDDPSVYIIPRNWSLDRVAQYKAKQETRITTSHASLASHNSANSAAASQTSSAERETGVKQATAHVEKQEPRCLPDKVFLLRR
jgi:hypothetical protein